MRKIFIHTYEDITSFENLLLGWRRFLKGKRRKRDVQMFEYALFENLQELHEDLRSKVYVHGGYTAFNISDPKPRNIHKASARDRVLHHALSQALFPHFDRTFISDSFSCRKGKGTHKALRRFEYFSRKVSQNDTRTVWVLKCDIRKFFASIDHKILLHILRKSISDDEILWLLSQVISSFSSTGPGKGLPLGNLTSQLLVNIYMNEFDQFVKHTLKAKYYVRYADDFVILHQDRDILLNMLVKIRDFLSQHLELSLHPHKVSITTLASGIDFLGWVHFPHHLVLRTTTKKRMFRTIQVKDGREEVVRSYLGLLKHGDGWKLEQKIFENMLPPSCERIIFPLR